MFYLILGLTILFGVDVFHHLYQVAEKQHEHIENPDDNAFAAVVKTGFVAFLIWVLFNWV